jgi:DNA-binding CsgD family transcriptional regulator
MQAETPRFNAEKGAKGIFNRIPVDAGGERDEALVFAVSSVIREITDSYYDGGSVVREVTTARGVYSICGSVVRTADLSQPVVVVHARGAAPAFLAEDEIREEFGLTRKEASVALLLAQQKSNEEIAHSLCISSHTARHHTQNILTKLHVASRTEVGALLTQR